MYYPPVSVHKRACFFVYMLCSDRSLIIYLFEVHVVDGISQIRYNIQCDVELVTPLPLLLLIGVLASTIIVCFHDLGYSLDRLWNAFEVMTEGVEI